MVYILNIRHRGHAMSALSNSIERREINGGFLTFDHATLKMTAHYADGSKATWSMLRYGRDEAFRAFQFSAERWSE